MKDFISKIKKAIALNPIYHQISIAVLAMLMTTVTTFAVKEFTIYKLIAHVLLGISFYCFASISRIEFKQATREYCMHFLMTSILVILVSLWFVHSGQFFERIPHLIVLGFLINAIPEVILPNPNIKDVYAGSLGGIFSVFYVFCILLILHYKNLYVLF